MNIRKKYKNQGGYFDIDSLKNKRDELTKLTEEKDFWQDIELANKISKDISSLNKVINEYQNLLDLSSLICITENEKEIQAIVAKPELGFDSINFGEAQNPGLDTYADKVDTMKFLEVI